MVDSPGKRERLRGGVEPRTTEVAAPRNPNSVALLAVTDSGAIISSDVRFAELFGIPARIVSTGSVSELVTWLAQEGDDAGVRIAKVIESEDGDGGEVCSSDGRVIAWSRVTTTGSERGSLFSFHDVGRQHAAVRALRDAENWLHMFAAHTGGAVLEVDADGRIVGTWSADAEILSIPEALLQGRTLSEVVGDAQAGEFERLIRGVIATGNEASFEYAFDAKDERKVFAMDASLLASEASSPAVVSVLVRDVTSQTRVQTQLVQAERLASVGLLAAGVAHEINNPLTYMVINFQRVRRGIRILGASPDKAAAAALATELGQCIDMMVEGAERVREIVRDLQRFSRTDRSETRELVDVRSVLERTLGLVSFELERHARVVREFGPVPLVLASEGRLSQVFLNLILNAVHALRGPHSDRNEIRLVTSTDARGDAVIEVRDTGSGITAADMRKIFDPFFTTKAPNVGTGLGLAICHGITRSLGGDITVDSKVGVGTVFRILLPAAGPAPTADDSRAPSDARSVD